MPERLAGSATGLSERGWFSAFLLIVVIAAAYQPVWQAGFIWDDDDHLTKNPCVVGPYGLKEIWTTSAARICPLVQTTFWLQHKLWGLNPLPYHVFNVLMHGAAAIMFWRVLRMLNIPGAWLGAALWALHPVQVETVAWITELKNTQSAFFFLLTILLFLRSVKTEGGAEGSPKKGRWIYFVLSIVAGGLAMTSKSSTVILPLVIGLCAWWLGCRRWRSLVLKLVPFFVLAAAASAVSIWTQDLEAAGAAGLDRSAAERFIVAGMVTWFYLGKLAWPEGLVFIYPRWEVNPAQIVSYLPTLLVMVLLGVLWWMRERWGRPGLFAFGYFLVALLPVLGLVDHYFLRYSYVGDHFQYLASLGAMGLTGAVIARLLMRLRLWMRTGGHVCCLALLLVLGILTWRQAWMYRDAETLWQTTIERNPDAWMAYNNLGMIFVEAGKINEAIGYFRKSVAAEPGYAKAQSNLGSAYYASGDLENAIASYRRALEIRPLFALDHFNLGTALTDAGQFDMAITHLRMALRIQPDNSEAAYTLGNAYLGAAQIDKAIVQYRTALELGRDSSGTHNNLGLALSRAGRTAEARDQFAAAVRADPANVHALKNLAWTLATSPDASVRDGARAVELAREAIRITGDRDPSLLQVLAAAHAESGAFSEASRVAQRAVDLASAGGKAPLAKRIRSELELYSAGVPFRESQEAPDKSAR